MLVIADAERAVAVAGVMGGADTEIGASTSRVLLEAAAFHGPQARRTARRLGLRTESSARFERSLDPRGVLAAAPRGGAPPPRVGRGGAGGGRPPPGGGPPRSGGPAARGSPDRGGGPPPRV